MEVLAIMAMDTAVPLIPVAQVMAATTLAVGQAITNLVGLVAVVAMAAVVLVAVVVLVEVVVARVLLLQLDPDTALPPRYLLLSQT